MPKRIHILGSNIDALTIDETIIKIKEFIDSKQCIQHVVVNANKINLMKDNEELREIVNSSSLINADGQSIVWAAKILGNPLPERVTGIDLFLKLVEIAEKERYKIYFFGAKQEVVEKLFTTFKVKYPDLKIVGYRNGYFKEEESEQIAKDIKNSQADILFVGFSSPKKEFWIKKYMLIMQVPFIMGVGGSFDVVTGITNRAPVWMQKCGLEWFYRFIQEPRRMWRRYLVGNIKFIKLLFKEKVSYIIKSLKWCK